MGAQQRSTLSAFISVPNVRSLPVFVWVHSLSHWLTLSFPPLIYWRGLITVIKQANKGML